MLSGKQFTDISEQLAVSVFTVQAETHSELNWHIPLLQDDCVWWRTHSSACHGLSHTAVQNCGSSVLGRWMAQSVLPLLVSYDAALSTHHSASCSSTSAQIERYQSWSPVPVCTQQEKVATAGGLLCIDHKEELVWSVSMLTHCWPDVMLQLTTSPPPGPGV